MKRPIPLTCPAILVFLSACTGGESTAENNTSSIIVDDDGGSLSLAGVTVKVPPGALNEPTQVSISLTENPPTPLPANRSFAGPVYMLTPHGLRFAKPVTLTLPRQEGSSELWSLEGPEDTLWSIEAHATLEAESATLMTTHFSYFAWLISTDADASITDASNHQDANLSGS